MRNGIKIGEKYNKNSTIIIIKISRLPVVAELYSDMNAFIILSKTPENKHGM